MGFWNAIWKSKTKDWTFDRLDPSQVPDRLPQAAIAPDTAYLSVFLRTMRVTDVRKGLSKFYGTAHSWISVPYLGSTNPAEFQVVVAPNDLRDKDPSNLDRVLTMNHRLLGPIPYRGGDLDVELGLFSIKSADLAAPFIGVLESMSSIAGVSFISAALPFMGPLKQGINLLTGGDKDTLEIGLAATWSAPTTGYFFVMRAPRGAIQTSSLKVQADFRLTDGAGNTIKDYPYLLVAVEASRQRDDWFQVPELSTAWLVLQAEVRKGSVAGTQEAFTTFKRIALTSPDLLSDDARRLVESVRKKLEETMTGALTSSRSAELPALQEMAIYGSGS